MRPLLVFGARPNFMKIAPLWRAFLGRGVEAVLLHTGQHSDPEMSEDFIVALDLPTPNVHLGVGRGSQAEQLSEIVKRLEPELDRLRPDVVVVVGDVTSTLAAALGASMAALPLAHVEAGLRSRDWSMPEERNRVLTDRLSTYLFTPSADADDNLVAEGIDEHRIHRVGNVMIDSLDWVLRRLDPEQVLREMGLAGEPFGLVTLHRPATVDDPAVLSGVLGALEQLSAAIPLVFPAHPRTRLRMEEYGLAPPDRVRVLQPVGYQEFISLVCRAGVVLTDSGGIQEETTVLGIPCLTLRTNTERPITLTEGTNRLVGLEPARIVEAALAALEAPSPAPHRPELWDGHAAERIVDALTGR